MTWPWTYYQQQIELEETNFYLVNWLGTVAMNPVAAYITESNIR